MKAALLKGPGEVVLEEVPVPEISNDQVLIEVKYCAICGTDVHAVPEAIFIPPGTYMGHEFSGVLAKVGKNVKGWKAGDRVAVNVTARCGECYACKHGEFWACPERFTKALGISAGLEYAGAFAKYVRVPHPEYRLYALPDEVSFEEGALVEPLACSLHAVRISAFRVGDYAMVLGVGGLGLGVIAFLKHGGAELVIAVMGRNKKRAELAKRLGADYVINPQEISDLKAEVLKLTNGRGFEGVDQVFDCSGAPQAFQSATNFLKYGGQIVVAGTIIQEVPIIPGNFTMRELDLQGSQAWTDEYAIVIDLLKKGTLPVKEMITSKIKLSDIVEKGFNALLAPDCNEAKILVSPE